MKAKVTKAFDGRPDGEALSRRIQEGEEIGGALAKVAVSEKWAEEIKEAPAAPAAKSKAKAG